MTTPAPAIFPVDLTAELARVSAHLNALLETEALPGTVLPAALGNAVFAYPRRSGKRLRPALLLWSCGLVGGKLQQAWPAALAVELYHNWTLVHDDIIDGDATRRGLPTCHVLLRQACPPAAPAVTAKFGADLAILAGDIQHGWAAASLTRCLEAGVRPAVVIALLRRLHEWLTPALISGEALDVEFAHRPPGTVPATEIEAMMAGKTGALLQFCAQTGAMIGLDETDPDRAEIATLGCFACEAGIAFQLVDDWLGLFADETKLGKPVGADLREGKQTMLIATALEQARANERAELLSLLGNRQIDDKDVRRARAIIRDCGAEAALLERARGLAASAAATLATFPANRFRALLEAWLHALTHRLA